jgi:hypothetical protein
MTIVIGKTNVGTAILKLPLSLETFEDMRDLARAALPPINPKAGALASGPTDIDSPP